jgi:hypothetical protein
MNNATENGHFENKIAIKASASSCDRLFTTRLPTQALFLLELVF